MATTQTMRTKANYAKLRDGSWGVSVTSAGPPWPGTVLTVTKRDGSTKAESVGHILWSGEGRYICRIKRNDAPRSAYRSGYGTGRGAGQAVSVAGYSEYCTDRPGCGCFDCAS